jgi:hypothetical protein
VELSTIHGDVQIRREGSGPVRLTADLPEKGGHRDAWRFEVRGDGDRIQAKVCCGKCDGQVFKDCPDGPIKVTALIPEKASLSLSCVSAQAKVEGGTGELSISTVSGPVSVTRSHGELSISSVSGEVTVSPSKARETSVNTVSGDVVLVFPEQADADISFSTLSGNGPKRSTLGRGGGAEVSVSTVSGDLRLRGAQPR